MNNRELKIKKIKKSKNDHKNISRTFSGFVVSIVGSVHFWLMPQPLMPKKLKLNGSIMTYKTFWN